ncbi:MAG: 50S ribosomal protein L5 [Candidatus Spechtbacteria bacterium]|nr:50S ribosomal protein L5 [Candidatus Spechtbacteria bacterium]
MKTTSLKERYKQEIVPVMREKFGYKNVHAVPALKKIVVNSGVGKMINAKRGKDSAGSEESVVADLVNEFALIVGQKPRIIRAHKSISGFKLREGMIAGVSATLRGQRMYDFLTRLIHIAFPRMRDFRGFEKKSVDQRGNMTIGVSEQIIFPEIPHDKVRQMWGMEISLATNAKNREEGIALLTELGILFQKA